jgi:hypothetical protein
MKKLGKWKKKKIIRPNYFIAKVITLYVIPYVELKNIYLPTWPLWVSKDAEFYL